MAGSDLGRRLIVAGLGIPLGTAAIYMGTWFVAVALVLVAGLGTVEVCRFAVEKGKRPFVSLGVAASVGLVVGAAYFDGIEEWSVYAVILIAGMGLAALGAAVFRRGPDEEPLASVSATLFAVLYLGGTLSFGVHLRALPGVSDGGAGWEGALVLLFAMTVPWFGDSAAYFTGRALGKTKLIPAVSPAKTVEGGIGGLVGATVIAMLYTVFLLNPYSGTELSLGAAAGIGLVVGAVAQIGDLAESLLKREAGVKDSGHVFPGHGGVLDRFDSILFTLPASYLLLSLALAR